MRNSNRSKTPTLVFRMCAKLVLMITLILTATFSFAQDTNLVVQGAYLLVEGLANEQAYLGGDGAGNDVQVGTFNPNVSNFAIWNASNSTRMNLFANDVYALNEIGVGGITSPSHPIHASNGAHLTAGGVWTDGSSLRYKENISNLGIEEAEKALMQLRPVKFNYKLEKDESYVGFIAEEVPDLVATNQRNGLSPMDIVAVLTKVVQQQQRQIEELYAILQKNQE